MRRPTSAWTNATAAAPLRRSSSPRTWTALCRLWASAATGPGNSTLAFGPAAPRSAPMRALGATGLTFYDDEVRAFLGTDEEPMLCVAVGVEARRARRRRR